MTNEELDEARVKEAIRLQDEMMASNIPAPSVPRIAARLARENWTPPEPVVDPDVLAFRGWVKSYQRPFILEPDVDAGGYDGVPEAHAYLAGARMARKQEQERAKVLVDHAEVTFNYSRNFSTHAQKALAKYRGEA